MCTHCCVCRHRAACDVLRVTCYVLRATCYVLVDPTNVHYAGGNMRNQLLTPAPGDLLEHIPYGCRRSAWLLIYASGERHR